MNEWKPLHQDDRDHRRKVLEQLGEVFSKEELDYLRMILVEDVNCIGTHARPLLEEEFLENLSQLCASPRLKDYIRRHVRHLERDPETFLKSLLCDFREGRLDGRSREYRFSCRGQERDDAQCLLSTALRRFGNYHQVASLLREFSELETYFSN